MLFDAPEPGLPESYKERNLYYKFFCGYFVNELISGHEERLRKLFDLIESSENVLPPKAVVRPKVDPVKARITFDFHLSQFRDYSGKNGRRSRMGKFGGEMADVLIYDGSAAVAIEVKYLQGVEEEKDVVGNGDRLREARTFLGWEHVARCLLVRKSAWKRRGGKFRKVRSASPPVAVIFWEDIVMLCGNRAVKQFFHDMVSKTRKDFLDK